MSEKWHRARRQARKYGFDSGRKSLRKVRTIHGLTLDAHREARGDEEAYVDKLEMYLSDYRGPR